MELDPKKKPPADFVIRLVGPGIRPWAVPFRQLSRVLDAVQRLVEQADEPEPGVETSQEKLESASALRLLDVRTSSAAYRVAAPKPENALRVLRVTGKNIESPAENDWSAATLSSLKELSEVARSLGCQIEFRLPGDGRHAGDVIAKVGPETSEVVEASAFISGPTSVYATIQRVGGATEMHCGVYLHDQQRMVICRVNSEELVRDLGHYIYKDVFLTGQATWLRHNFELKRLTINSFEPPKTGSILDALRRIRDAGGDAWDRVRNPDAAISEMRGA